MDRLLEEPFPGRDEVRKQLEQCTVRFWEGCESHCGSIEFLVTQDAARLSADIESPLDVNGQFTDIDEIPVDVMLFHKDGFIESLEFVVYSDMRKSNPDPAVVVVSRLPPR